MIFWLETSRQGKTLAGWCVLAFRMPNPWPGGHAQHLGEVENEVRRIDPTLGRVFQRDDIISKCDMHVAAFGGDRELVERSETRDTGHVDHVDAILEVCDRIVAPVVGKHEGIRALTAIKRVIAETAHQDVCAFLTAKGVVIIGVYNRNIGVPQLPATLVLSLVVRLVATKPVDTDVEFQCLAAGERKAGAKGHLKVSEAGSSLFRVPALPILDIDSECDLDFQWRVAPKGHWETICSVPLVCG